MTAKRRRLIVSAGACMVLAGSVLPLVGTTAASAAPVASAYSGDAYAVGLFGVKVLNPLVTLSDTKINEVGPFNGPTPQSGDSGAVTINQVLPGLLSVKAAAARQTVTEGNSASSASSQILGAVIGLPVRPLVTADVLSTSTSASCSGSPTASFNIVNLKVAGITVNPTVSPNTTVTVKNLSGTTIAIVGLNQTTSSTTAGHSEVSASTLVVTFPSNGALSGVIQGSIVVAHAESDVTCGPGGPPTFVSYADTVRQPGFTPTPWLGSPNTLFIGTPPPWDTGGVRVDNTTATAETAYVTVDIGAAHYDLWGTQTIPPANSLVLSATSFSNFDTSETNPNSCTPNLVIPVIHTTINGVTTDHLDTARVLTTHGIDSAFCSGNSNEGIQWTATT